MAECFFSSEAIFFITYEWSKFFTFYLLVSGASELIQQSDCFKQSKLIMQSVEIPPYTSFYNSLPLSTSLFLSIPLYPYLSLSIPIYPYISLSLSLSPFFSIFVVPCPASPPVTIILGLKNHTPLIPIPT